MLACRERLASCSRRGVLTGTQAKSTATSMTRNTPGPTKLTLLKSDRSVKLTPDTPSVSLLSAWNGKTAQAEVLSPTTGVHSTPGTVCG